MILNIKGDINRYYVQTLCMIFFPGSTFGENEVSGGGIPEVSVELSELGDGGYTAEVSMKLNDKVCTYSSTVLATDEIHIADRQSLAVGKAMFAAGKALLGHVPPWGILTGVRPAKIAGKVMRMAGGILKSKRILRDEYFLNAQKAGLAVGVAQSEAKILKRMKDNSCSVYISIPFCPSRCAYCSFVSYTTPRLLSLIDDYLDALLSELYETVKVIKMLGLTVSTVYIGGGTPTTLNEKQLKKLLSRLFELIKVDELEEFTLEAGRPDTITEGKLKIAKEFGVTRISVNPQTLNDEILKEIGRKHTTLDFYKAYALAKESGIRDINVDLIAGLPGDDFGNFSETIDKVIDLAPTNITVHTFCVKKASDLLKNNSSVYSLTGGDVAKSVIYSQLKTKFASYKPYYMYRQKNTVGNLENVGFSVEGHEGLYNVYMMEETQTIFAVGAGAVTKLVDFDREKSEPLRIERIFNPKYPYEYLKLDTAKNADKLYDAAVRFFSVK